MAEFSIGEVAGRMGLRPSAIRYYESAGLLPRAPRRNGRRRFDESVFARLSLIDLAQRAGFTIQEIRRLLHGFSKRTSPSVRWRHLTERKLAEIDARIAEAREMRRILERLRRCECPSLDDCAPRRAGR